jgi:hypothetical protein
MLWSAFFVVLHFLYPAMPISSHGCRKHQRTAKMK